MESLALWFSASGRMAPKPFACAMLVVYAAALLSLLLMPAPVTSWAGLLPFALVQALAAWAWFCLNAKRLRDAGRDVGAAAAIALLYALAIVLFLLTVTLVMPLGGAARTPDAGWSGLLAIARSASDLGLFAYVGAGLLALVLAPMLIAIVFSIWAATRRSAGINVTPR
ncbi:MAG TPA: hypothetical protein VH397_03420 [Xanthobacteraceae bacterium]|jgi:hypothetical protein